MIKEPEVLNCGIGWEEEVLEKKPEGHIVEKKNQMSTLIHKAASRRAMEERKIES